MRMLDLFSGIGGFALAASWVWGDQLEIVSFVEWDKFCQQVLRKNFPGVPIHDDIKTFKWPIADTEYEGDKTNDRTMENKEGEEKEGKQESWGSSISLGTFSTGTLCESKNENKNNNEPIDLITGGFPCQPFSTAGKRRGKEDSRYLWPEMLRVISEVRPTWVIGENVAGIIGMAQPDCEPGVECETVDPEEGDGGGSSDGTLHRIIEDLEGIGYDVQTFCIPACGVGAPHRRDRVWIVAHAKGERSGGKSEEVCGKERGQVDELLPDTINADSHAPDTECKGSEGTLHNSESSKWIQQKLNKRDRKVEPNAPDCTGHRLQERGMAQHGDTAGQPAGGDVDVADSQGLPLRPGLRPDKPGGIGRG